MFNPWSFLVTIALLFSCAVEAKGAPISWQDSAAPAAAGGNKIVVTVKKLRSDRGVVLCALFDGEGFPRAEAALRRAAPAPIKGGEATCEFIGVKPGEYAVATIHDENQNGVLDTGLLGIPKEGIGASNDAKASFGPPKFQDARFTHPEAASSLQIQTMYL